MSTRQISGRVFSLAALLFVDCALGDLREIVDEETLRSIAAEVSGEEAKRNLDRFALHHRMRASDQFDDATAHIVSRLEHYGLDDVETVQFVADGKTMYGTQKSRPKWEVDFAELWELKDDNGRIVKHRRLASWDAVPLSLAQDSLSGEVTTTLVDIGAGLSDDDYAGKDVRGKLVLTSSQPGAVAAQAVAQRGAAGIVSYAPNQRSAWWLEDERLVRWGHLSSFPTVNTFGFMISLGEARKLQARLAAEENITFHAKVDARHVRGDYVFAESGMRGSDAALAGQEIVLTCHLDHPRPGANDNASGCAAILEVARTLSALIRQELVPRPRRSIRFLWPAEIEGSIMYLAEHAAASDIKANIHMDMVGGGPQTKAVFRISGGPMSLPTFIADVGFEIGNFITAETVAFASGRNAEFPLNAPEGGKDAQVTLLEGLDMGSDHDVFREGSWRIPGLYLHDWPDRYIHTNFDTTAMVDPTKLKRAAFIGAVAALYLADLSAEDVPALLELLKRNALKRTADLRERLAPLGAYDRAAVARIRFEVERRTIDSIDAFAALSQAERADAYEFIAELERLVAVPVPSERLARDETVYARDPAIQGPMSAFGYSYFRDRYGDEAYAELQLPRYTGTHGSGGEYAYEALNLVDGSRTVSDIRDWLTAELGPVPLEYVGRYLAALAEIQVIRPVEGQD